MKTEGFEKLFKRFSSYKEFCNWLLENDPETLEPWTPSLTPDEIAIINDYLKPNHEYLGYLRFDNFEDFFLFLDHVREAKKENLDLSRVPFLLEKLSKYSHDWESIFEKHNISIKETIEDLICKLLEEVGKNPKSAKKLNLSDWAVSFYAPITHLKSGIEIWGDYPKWPKGIHLMTPEKIELDLVFGKYWHSFKEIIIKFKKEEIKQNPQDWRIERRTNMYGEHSVDVVRKSDDRDELSKKWFTFSEFTKIEWELEGWKNVKFWLPVLLVIILLLVFFWWWYRKRKK